MSVPALIDAPGYWRDETSGVLQPAINAYLLNRALSPAQIAAIRAYCRQWINAPGFIGAEVEAMRRAVDSLTDRASIQAWLTRAEIAGVDPL